MISVINQNTMVLELGSGTIRGSVKGRKGRVALLLKNGEARRIGPFINEESKGKFTDVIINESPLVMFFNNTECVDSFIDSLKIVRSLVAGDYKDACDAFEAGLKRMSESQE